MAVCEKCGRPAGGSLANLCWACYNEKRIADPEVHAKKIKASRKWTRKHGAEYMREYRKRKKQEQSNAG